MEDFLKKFFYTGVGYANSTMEKVKKKVGEFVEEGKLSESEGAKFMKDIMEEMDGKREVYEEKMKSNVERILARFDFPTREEVQELRAKIEALEEKLAAQKTTETVTETTDTVTDEEGEEKAEENSDNEEN